jgi:hypothetical protein
MRAGLERLSEILRVLHERGHNKPGIAVRFHGAMVVFGQNRVPAVRDTVLTQVSRTHVSGDDFQIAPSGWFDRTGEHGHADVLSFTRTFAFPLRDGIALPGWLSGLRL